MKDGRLGILIAAGVALWLWSRRGGAVAALASTVKPETAAEAQAQAAQVASQLAAFAQRYPEDPTLADHTAQAAIRAAITLESGIPLSESLGAETFFNQLQEYEAYKAAGGAKNFEDFSLRSLDAAGTKWYNWRLSGEFVAEPIGRTGGERITEPVMTISPLPVIGAPVPYIPPAEVAAAVEQGAVPEGFTASGSQLEALEEAGYTKDTEVYQEAVDYSYVEAARDAEESGGVVSWSSDGGYETISNEEAASNPDYW